MAELSDAAWVRLLKYAGWRIRGVPFGQREGRDARDLLDSAFEATLDGTRRWNKENDIVKHLERVMGSLANHWTMKAHRDTSILAADLGPAGDGSRDRMAEMPARGPSPESQAVTKDMLANIEALLADDADATVVWGGLRDKLPISEIARILDVEIVTAETIATRIRRKARAAFPEGKLL